MTTNSIDLTPICVTGMGVVLLLGYLVFSYLVTHRGDFYHVRRWKAAFWVADFFGIILAVIVLYFSFSTLVGNLPGRNLLELAIPIIIALFSTFAFIIPFVFVIAFGMHHQLKWWLNSDDFLDKIWRDPNKGNKNPVQEL